MVVVKGITRTLELWQAQHDVCRNVAVAYSPPQFEQLIVVSEGVLEGEPTGVCVTPVRIICQVGGCPRTVTTVILKAFKHCTRSRWSISAPTLSSISPFTSGTGSMPLLNSIGKMKR